MRTVPAEGLVIAPSDSDAINEVLQQGCWTDIARIGQREGKRVHAQDNAERWSFAGDKSDGSSFSVLLNDEPLGAVHWSLFGEHNKANALNAIAAARHAGVEPKQAIEAL